MRYSETKLQPDYLIRGVEIIGASLHALKATTPLVADVFEDIQRFLCEMGEQLKRDRHERHMAILEGRTEAAVLMRKINGVDLAYHPFGKLKFEESPALLERLRNAHIYRDWLMLLAVGDEEADAKFDFEFKDMVIHEYYTLHPEIFFDRTTGELTYPANITYTPTEETFPLPASMRRIEDYYTDLDQFLSKYDYSEKATAVEVLPKWPEDFSYSNDVDVLNIGFNNNRFRFKVMFKAITVGGGGAVTLDTEPDLISIHAVQTLGLRRDDNYWLCNDHQYHGWEKVPYFFREAILKELLENREQYLRRYEARMARRRTLGGYEPNLEQGVL